MRTWNIKSNSFQNTTDQFCLCCQMARERITKQEFSDQLQSCITGLEEVGTPFLVLEWWWWRFKIHPYTQNVDFLFQTIIFLFALISLARWCDVFTLNIRGRLRAKLPTRQMWEQQVVIKKVVIPKKAKTTKYLQHLYILSNSLQPISLQMYLKQAIEIRRMTEVLG